MYKIVSSVILVCCLLVGFMPLAAQDSKDKEIEALKARVDRLEQQLQNKQEAGKPAAKDEKTADSAVADSAAKEDRPMTLEELLKSTPLLSFIKDWKFGGNIQVTYNYNFNSPDDQATSVESRRNRARFFDDKSNQFDFNQLVLWVEKATSEESPVGFGFELFLGRDAKKIHSLGLGIQKEDGQSEREHSDIIDLAQAYITGRIPVGNGLEIKVGKFYGACGYESVRRSENYFASMGLVSSWLVPTSLTGITATYSPIEQALFTVGVVNGWDAVEDNNTGKTLLAVTTLTPFANFEFDIGIMWGAEQNNQAAEKRFIIDLIAIYQPMPGLTLGLNFDYGEENGAVFTTAGQPKRGIWHGLAAYFSYEFTDFLSAGVRGEYLCDERGARLGFVDPDTGEPERITMWAITLNVRGKLLEHLFVTLEYRHDQTTHHDKYFDYHDRLLGKDRQNTILAEVMYQF